LSQINKIIIFNILVSFLVFAIIFYIQAGTSGGDMAIIIFNILAGLIHIVLVCLYFTFKKLNVLSAVNLAIILSQIVEMVIFAEWGYPLNEFIKNFKQ
jgi:hypothetical protein